MGLPRFSIWHSGSDEVNFCTPMRTNLTEFPSAEFYFPRNDTLILVENSSDGVLVRATRGTFSDPEKERFVRRLAMEGFIADSFQWFSWGQPNVRWVIDYSWVKLNPEMLAGTRRWMIKLLVSASALWVILILSLFVFAAQKDQPVRPHRAPSSKAATAH